MGHTLMTCLSMICFHVTACSVMFYSTVINSTCHFIFPLCFYPSFPYSVAMSCSWQVTWVVPLFTACAVQCLLLADGCGVAAEPPAKLCAHVCDVIARGDPLFSPLMWLTALQLGRVSVRLCVGALFYLGRGGPESELFSFNRFSFVSGCQGCSCLYLHEDLYAVHVFSLLNPGETSLPPLGFLRGGHRVFSHTDLSLFFSSSLSISLSSCLFASSLRLLIRCKTSRVCNWAQVLFVMLLSLLCPQLP